MSIKIAVLTLNGHRRFQVIEVWLDVGIGADVGGHTTRRRKRRCGIARNGAMLVVHVVSHAANILLELAAVGILRGTVVDAILTGSGCMVGRKLAGAHGAVGEILAGGGVWRSGLAHRASSPNNAAAASRSEGAPRHKRLLGRVLGLEAWASVPVGC